MDFMFVFICYVEISELIMRFDDVVGFEDSGKDWEVVVVVELGIVVIVVDIGYFDFFIRFGFVDEILKENYFMVMGKMIGRDCVG